MSVRRLLSAWSAEPSVAGHFADWRSLPARPAQFKPLPDHLEPHLAAVLKSQGIKHLYIHQAACWQIARAGQNMVVVTGTASGKTLCYNLPVVDRLVRDPEARALYLFPTKALARDQLAALKRLIPGDGSSSAAWNPIGPAVYDGDTPQHERQTIRRLSRLVISNPDMLHTGILPHHPAWAEFFASLRFIVIDEIHAYRGVFGSHVANVIRRLTRVCRHYGASPQFILTSATIANPVELAERLAEAPVALIDQDGAARGQKTFLIYNPPVLDPSIGLRRSALQETVRLAGDLLTYGVQTIIFGRSRRTVELVLTYLRERNEVQGSQSAGGGQEPAIRGYRSGYLPGQRREIEGGLRNGQVRAVVATNALELGIDIGDLSAALLVGYPGTISGAWQQAGRAGRGRSDSLAVLVATADPLDQFLASHPDYFFGRSPEQALINPDNLLILLDHLRCAAFELPFEAGDGFGRLSPPEVQEFLDFLRQQGQLHRSGEKYFWMAEGYPAQTVSLRSASADSVILHVVDPKDPYAPPVVIGQVDRSSALWMVHPQAVYLHEAQPYLVDSLDLENGIARLQPSTTEYYTQPSRETVVEPVEVFAQVETPGGRKLHGEIQVTTQVVGFRKIRWYTHENLGLGELDLPPTQLQTTGYWLTIDSETVEALTDQGLWRSAPIDYGVNWPAQRERARMRDEYRCQICGAPESGRSHDVHHKTPFRAFESFREANRLENLITLCHSCHRRAETAVRVRSGLSGLAFVLGHLAPLFVMCDTNDLGVHADPKSPLAEGGSAVVLYDQVPGGIGLSPRLFEMHEELLARARELVSACECSDGCPSCVGPGGERGLGGKRETLALLDALLQNV